MAIKFTDDKQPSAPAKPKPVPTTPTTDEDAPAPPPEKSSKVGKKVKAR